MIKNTLILVGPGGIGKSPLDHIFKQNLLRIDPYRMRASGPRDKNDVLYANPKLRSELHLVCQALNLSFEYLSPTVEWVPQAWLLFFKVRDDWQLLLLEDLKADIAKAEIYAPIIPILLSQPRISHVFGKTAVVVLHPATQKLSTMADWSELEEKTRQNCLRRGDEASSVKKRVDSIKEEAPAWKLMIKEGATEYENWQFPEHAYKPKVVTGSALVQHQVSLLLKAKTALTANNSRLEVFFKTDAEIEAKCGQIVK